MLGLHGLSGLGVILGRLGGLVRWIGKVGWWVELGVGGWEGWGKQPEMRSRIFHVEVEANVV